METNLSGVSSGSWLHVRNDVTGAPLRYFLPGRLSSVQCWPASASKRPAADAFPLGVESDLWWLLDALRYGSPLHEQTLVETTGRNSQKAYAQLIGANICGAELVRANQCLLESKTSGFRDTTCWVGGTLDHCRFIPAPSSAIPQLIEDLSLFLSRTAIPTLVLQALSFY